MKKWWNSYTHLSNTSLSRSSPAMGTKPASWIQKLLHPPPRLWAVPCWSSNLPTSRSNALRCCNPPLLLINTFLLYLPSTTANTGGVVPFCNLLILSIVRCFYNGDILYYLCATVTFTTFTSAIWSPHGNFTKVYFYTPVEFVLGSHKKLGLKHEFVTR